MDLILGADVFDAHGAVIDYPSQSLFLRAVAAEPGAGAVGAGTSVSTGV